MTWTPHRSRRRSPLPKRSGSAAAALVLLMAAASCAPKRFVAPAGAGAPVAGFAEAWQRTSARCAGVRTLTAELALSGRAGGTRLRGRVQAGFEAPGRIRLEGVAPFGQPVFILAGDAARATLLLPRDERVVSAADVSEILDALIGVRLGADDLLAILRGCPLAAETPTGATAHGNLVRFAFADGDVYLRQTGVQHWLVAARVRSFFVEYFDRGDIVGKPWRVRISRQGADGDGVDLTITVSQVERNITLPAEAFTIDVPPGTAPMTLAELRAAGPLGAKD